MTGAPTPVARQSSAKDSHGRRGKLFHKYILLFAALVGGTLLANGALELWFSYQENKQALARIQQEKALAAAARIELFIDEITRQIGWTTRAQWSRTVLEQRRFEYLQLLRQAPAVTEVSHLDAQGRECPPGTVGEIYMMPAPGQGATYRYLGAEPSATPDGWETLGDLGWLDAEGWLYLADRKTDMVVVGAPTSTRPRWSAPSRSTPPCAPAR